jgi:F-type H+-transporting ATPase subunit delta
MTNTKNTLIAQRYAEALVEIARDGKLTFEKTSKDLNLINEILMQSKDLNAVLINPIISIEDKKEIIDKVFSGEIDLLTINFLKLLTDKNKFDIFNDVLEAYNKSMDSINNIKRVSVTSAVTMNEDAKSRLKQKLEEKLKANVVIDLNINKDIIAGLVIKIDDNVIDMSLKHKLEDLSKSITR